MMRNQTPVLGSLFSAPRMVLAGAWQGYQDAKANHPFRADYEHWPQPRQSGYEQGRLIAVNIMAMQIDPPDWVAPEAGSEELVQAWGLSRAIAGNPIPILPGDRRQ